MREAIGSSWLVYILVIFLLIYIFFMGFVMRYASAYRAANYVVTQIENCQARCADNLDEFKSAIRSKYRYIEGKTGGLSISCSNNGNGSVYRVELVIDFDVPLLGTVRPFNVRAETKTIQNYSCK